MIKNKKVASGGLRYTGVLLVLILSALILAGRLGYFYLSDAERFPITTIKVAASYEHITHKELETILAKYLSDSFFALPVSELQAQLNALHWIDTAYVERVWPDTLKIKLVEKKPIAVWGNALMTKDGKLFNEGSVSEDLNIPHLKGPLTQQAEVLQVYEKLSKILSLYGLKASGLYLRDNQSWVLILGDGVKIYGKERVRGTIAAIL